jgi:hypothetical protein
MKLSRCFSFPWYNMAHPEAKNAKILLIERLENVFLLTSCESSPDFHSHSSGELISLGNDKTQTNAHPSGKRQRPQITGFLIADGRRFYPPFYQSCLYLCSRVPILLANRIHQDSPFTVLSLDTIWRIFYFFQGEQNHSTSVAICFSLA